MKLHLIQNDKYISELWIENTRRLVKVGCIIGPAKLGRNTAVLPNLILQFKSLPLTLFFFSRGDAQFYIDRSVTEAQWGLIFSI